MGNVKPFRLDDNTIIYVQSNEDIDTTELTEALENQPAPDDNALEDDLVLPPSTPPSPDSDEGDYKRVPKGLPPYSNRHGISQTNKSSKRPTPAQRVGTLVNAYTNHVIKDIRDTALTEVQVEKVALEFGIGLDTKAQIPYIASSSLECSVKVTIECKLNPPSAPPPTESSSDASS